MWNYGNFLHFCGKFLKDFVCVQDLISSSLNCGMEDESRIFVYILVWVLEEFLRGHTGILGRLYLSIEKVQVP